MQELLQTKIIEIGHFYLSVWNISKIVLLILFLNIALHFIRKIINRTAKRANLYEGRYHSVYLIIKYVVWIFAFVTCLGFIGIKPTIFLAGGAALLVGIGFGVQNIFKDIISGLFLLIEGTISIGDVVNVEGDICRVKRLNLRNTQVISRDDMLITVPNHILIENTIKNWTEYKTITRFTVKVGVEYGCDTDLVKKLLLQAASTHGKVVKKPPPFVRFQAFGTSALEFELFFWTTEGFRVEDIQSDLRFIINHLFKENGLIIAFPQLDVHMK